MVAQTSTLRIIVDSRNAQKSAEDFDKALKSIEKDGISASKSMDGMGGSLKSLAGYMAGVVSVGKAIAMADGYTQMAARIRNATSSAQEYAMVQDRILETANGTYRSLSEAQEVYLSLAGGMKSLGKTTADTLDVADSLSYAFVANAARADQAQSAMDALNKSMAKGKIDADAWISIVSAADNVIADMAKHTGKTEAQIRQLGATGKASLTDLLETLKATRDTNKQLADNMENSVADGFQKLTNSTTVYLGKLNEASGATGVIAAALGSLGDNIDKVAVAGGVLASVMVGRVASGYAAATIAAIANTSATAASAGAMATATAAARALYIALGGPVGLAITVAGAAASYLLLSNNANENTKSLRENNESVKDAISAYTQLDAVQKRAQLAKEKSDLKELSDSYENLTSKLNTNAYALSRHNDFTQAQSKEVNALIAEFKRTGDLDKFSASINKLSYVSQDSKDKFNALAGQVRTTGNEYKTQKQFIDAASNAMNGNAVAANNSAAANRNAAAAVSEYTDKLKAQKWDLEYTNALIDKGGYSARRADLTLQAYRENEKKGIKGILPEQRKLILGIEAEEKAAQKRFESQRAAASSQKKAASDSARAAKQQATLAKQEAKQAERTAEEIQSIREQYYYAYASKEKQIEMDLQAELADIRKAGLGGDYETRAKARADAEKSAYRAQMDYEINAYKMTEAEKLKAKLDIDQKILVTNQQLTAKELADKSKALNEQYKLEFYNIQLNSQKRLLDAEKDFITKKEYIERLGQIERDEIALNMSYSDAEKKRLTQLSGQSENQQFGKGQDAALGNLQSMTHEMQGTSDFARLEEQLEQRKQILQEAKDWEIISEEDRVNRLLEVEEAYQQSKRDLTLSSTEQIFGSMASMFDKDDDRQKKYYKAMITMEKGAAIARSMIAIQAGIAQAASQPFPANLAAMVTVASQTASIITNLKAIKADGFAEGGYTGNGGKYDVAGLVHKGEVVFSKADVARNGGVQAVESMRKGESSGANIVVQPNVIINIPEGMGATRNVSSDGTITIDVIDGWNQTLLANPNSKTRKGLAQNTTAGARR